jgi:hypothetical protein
MIGTITNEPWMPYKSCGFLSILLAHFLHFQNILKTSKNGNQRQYLKTVLIEKDVQRAIKTY